MKAGAATALAVLAAPAAALLPLISAGPGHDSPCGQLLANARVKPVAPPPGKTMPLNKPVRTAPVPTAPARRTGERSVPAAR
jgi:hypothetical protein